MKEIDPFLMRVKPFVSKEIELNNEKKNDRNHQDHKSNDLGSINFELKSISPKYPNRQ